MKEAQPTELQRRGKQILNTYFAKKIIGPATAAMADVRKSLLPASMNAEKRRTENFRREILVLIHRHLQDEGLVEAAEAMEKQVGNQLEQFQV